MDDMFVITDRDGRPVIRVAFLAPGYFVFHYPVEGRSCALCRAPEGH